MWKGLRHIATGGVEQGTTSPTIAPKLRGCKKNSTKCEKGGRGRYSRLDRWEKLGVARGFSSKVPYLTYSTRTLLGSKKKSGASLPIRRGGSMEHVGQVDTIMVKPYAIRNPSSRGIRLEWDFMIGEASPVTWQPERLVRMGQLSLASYRSLPEKI